MEEVERELEDAQDARTVAEQVNDRLKAAMEEQSLEIVRLRGLLGSLGVNASGDWATPADHEVWHLKIARAFVSVAKRGDRC